MGIRDAYFIRIYRRDRKDPRILVGTVEANGFAGKRGFTSFDELKEILISPLKSSREGRRTWRSNRRGEEPQ